MRPDERRFCKPRTSLVSARWLWLRFVDTIRLP
jgi:hypothetical protein